MNNEENTNMSNEHSPLAYVVAAAFGIGVVYVMMPEVFALMVERVQHFVGG